MSLLVITDSVPISILLAAVAVAHLLFFLRRDASILWRASGYLLAAGLLCGALLEFWKARSLGEEAAFGRVGGINLFLLLALLTHGLFLRGSRKEQS